METGALAYLILSALAYFAMAAILIGFIKKATRKY